MRMTINANGFKLQIRIHPTLSSMDFEEACIFLNTLYSLALQSLALHYYILVLLWKAAMDPMISAPGLNRCGYFCSMHEVSSFAFLAFLLLINSSNVRMYSLVSLKCHVPSTSPAFLCPATTISGESDSTFSMLRIQASRSSDVVHSVSIWWRSP